MTTYTVLTLLSMLFVKHFYVDFPIQGPYQWMNNGKYGHFGGLLHAGLHGITTAVILFFFVTFQMSFFLGFLDMVIHYHIDWAKMNINERYGWKSNQHSVFWTLLGIDQLLHSMTYVLIVYLVI